MYNVDYIHAYKVYALNLCADVHIHVPSHPAARDVTQLPKRDQKASPQSKYVLEIGRTGTEGS